MRYLAIGANAAFTVFLFSCICGPDRVYKGSHTASVVLMSCAGPLTEINRPQTKERGRKRKNMRYSMYVRSTVHCTGRIPLGQHTKITLPHVSLIIEGREQHCPVLHQIKAGIRHICVSGYYTFTLNTIGAVSNACL